MQLLNSLLHENQAGNVTEFWILNTKGNNGGIDKVFPVILLLYKLNTLYDWSHFYRHFVLELSHGEYNLSKQSAKLWDKPKWISRSEKYL